MAEALAYYNYSRWVADCPHPKCNDARLVNPDRLEDVCAHGHPMTIVMPSARQAAQIEEVLAERAMDADRAWYPAGHVRAKMAGQPVGQSVAELREENAKVAELRTRQSQDRKAQLAALLAEHGVDVDAAGRFTGRL